MMQTRIPGFFMPVTVLLLTQGAGAATPPLDLDLETTGAEYRTSLPRIKADDELGPVLELGKRNLDFLTYLNSFRDPANPLSFSSAAAQSGYPMDHPHEMSPAIIQGLYADVRAQMPAPLNAILFGGAEFTQTPPIPEADYLVWGLRLDGVYQKAARWELEFPFLDYYKKAAKRDIRGSYYLAREPGLEATLRGWSGLTDDARARLRPWLIGLCYNDPREASPQGCADELARQEAREPVAEPVVTEPNDAGARGVWSFYQSYVASGKAMFDSYFTISSHRSDVTWTAAAPDLFQLPFQDPGTSAVRDFLTGNIEDEWRIADWKLKLDFASAGPDSAHVVFLPGVNPHVNGLGGNEITMDANQPLTEYNVQWTIRHEFGHVLGFPDCYAEFYDEARGTILSYQIDLDDLMCSRRGHLRPRHYDELKRVYFQAR